MKNIKNLFLISFFFVNASSVSFNQNNIEFMVNKLNRSGRFKNGIIGIVEKGNIKFYPFGAQFEKEQVYATQDTLFEIGSVTKIFTNLLMLVAQQEGKLRVGDSLGGYLEGMSPDVQQITFKELSLHTSGLPRLPQNLDLSAVSLENPYKDYVVSDLMVALKKQKITNKNHLYSNLGTGVLGHILSCLYETDYEKALKEKVLFPLGLHNTTITLSEEDKKNVIEHYTLTKYGNFKLASLWDFDVLAPAGALKSSAKDMTLFVSHCLELEKSSLTSLMKEQQTIFDIGLKDREMGYGWVYSNNIYWHSGATGQSYSFVGFDKDSKQGIVILANSRDFILSILSNVGVALLDNETCFIMPTWKACWHWVMNLFA